MNLEASLKIALTGLATAQRALGVTAHNVANAATEGYTRKVHRQDSVVHDGQGAGARVLVPRRVADEFLSAELRQQSSRLGRSEVVADLIERAQSRLFGAPGETRVGIKGQLRALAGALESLANDPAKSAQRAQILSAAQSLAQELARAGEQVQTLRREADQRIGRLIDEINGEVAELETVDRELARGPASSELEDRRDRLLAGLARKLDISIYRYDDERIGIYLRGGQPLLEGTRRVLVYEPAPAVGRTTLFAPIRSYHERDIDPATGTPLAGAVGARLVSGGLRAELPPELVTGTPADDELIIRSPLASGELQGLLEVRDRHLPELADQIDELARIVRFALNAAHNAANAWPPPESLTGSRIEDGTFDAAARSGTAWLAVVDRTSGQTLHTVAVDLSADFATLVGQLDADLAGYGSAAIDGEGRLALTVAPGTGLALADGDGAITVTDPLGHEWSYGFAHYFGLNDLLIADPDRPTELSVSAALVADPNRLAAGLLEVEVGPPPVAALGGPGDGRGAQRLAAAFREQIPTVPRGSLAVTPATINDYANDLLATTAVRTAHLAAGAGADRAMVEELEGRVAEVSGVNMDEELARLVLYQQAYSVSARIVQITNELFDELVGLAR